ncbi:esterase family protein [Streptomyces sp. AD16]|nr:esterase family protein [Streptomyces sp. AD16]
MERRQGRHPAVRTHVLREVMPLVEREYGAGTRRAAAGESQGGFGVLGMAARVPGLFRAVASFGAPVHPVRHAEMWLSGAAYVGVDGHRIFGDPWRQWDVWLDWDPYRHAAGLRSTRVHLSSGDGTPALSTATNPTRTSPAPRSGWPSPTTASSR